MKIFLICYGIICVIGMICTYFCIKHAKEVPQDIDIYDL